MAEVVDIRSRNVVEFPPKEPIESVVTCLEELLELARKGEVVGICVAVLEDTHDHYYRMAGYPETFGIVGALHTMAHMLQESIASQAKNIGED
jgi:hypothetical protein